MSLKKGDLRDLVDNIIEIDSFKSKMGNDEDVITVAFSLKTKESGDDLVGFFEKGYGFILDADLTAGEQIDGTYKVFVEIERNKDSTSQIMELVDGLKNLSNLEKIKFRYYKNFRSYPVTQENLDAVVPNDPSVYHIMINENRLENYKNFFSKSYLDEVNMINDTLNIKKIYADPLNFKFIDFGNKEEINESIEEKININDYAEILFLTKYIGDYNITKYGNKIVFENENKSLVVERI